jgi:hypothetical protein
MGKGMMTLSGAGGFAGVYGIYELIHETHNRSGWFWLFLGATILFVAQIRAVQRLLKERDEVSDVERQREKLLATLGDALRRGDKDFYSNDWWKETCDSVSSIDAAYGAELEGMSESFYMEWPDKLRQIMRQVRDGAHLAPPALPTS